MRRRSNRAWRCRRCADGNGSQSPVGLPENQATRVFGRSAWQNWIFIRPNATGQNGALKVYGTGAQPSRQGAGVEGTKLSRPRQSEHDQQHRLQRQIPNNVDLGRARVLQGRSSTGSPPTWAGGTTWGPTRVTTTTCNLRTAISVDREGWAQFDYVKMPQCRWGIFVAPPTQGREVNFGANKGQPAWQDVPGEYRSMLRRIIVTQGDTEPASVEQQKMLGMCAPSLYDLRNIYQVNVEEGRHLWAMVYLLHRYLAGRTGRGGGAARSPLRRLGQNRASRCITSRHQTG